MIEFLRRKIEGTPQNPVDLVGKRALTALGELQTALLRQEEVTPTCSLKESAISNMNFINETISPLVREFFSRTGKRLEFSGLVYRVWDLNKSGKLGYHYNWIDDIGMGTGFKLLKKKDIRNWLKINDLEGDLIKDFAKMTKEQIIELFENSITQTVTS